MRRRRLEDEDNPDRWLVSYADFITLLFAFFVVMYAISSVNEGKYRVLTRTLTDAFQSQPRGDRGLPLGEAPGAALIELPAGLEAQLPPVLPEPLSGQPLDQPLDHLAEQAHDPAGQPALPLDQPGPEEASAAAAPIAPDQQLLKLGAALEQALGGLILQDLASVDYRQDWIELNLASQLLFDTGDARLNQPALRALRQVSEVLKPVPNAINIEGYTDDVPIRTAAFPSNWELSAARAASVAHFLARLGLAPGRLSAVGFAEYRPRADNATAEGRAQNRRVTLLILSAERSTRQRGSIRVLSEAEVL
jgi:chemotaxis protein MotB